jgi:hypothetical protein
MGIALLLALWVAADPPPPDPEPTPLELRVLFLGNSLTFENDLPGIVEHLVESAGAGPVTVEAEALPDAGLEDHWRRKKSRRAVATGRFDLVVLQQGPSATEGRPSLLEFSRRFAAEARATGGTVGLYMVWPALGRLGDFDGVAESYRLAAEGSGGLLFPVGWAWRLAWSLDPELPLYASDGFHPGPLGSYLAALVIFEQLTGRSPVGLPARFRTAAGVSFDLDPDTAHRLQQVAAEANRRYAVPVEGWPRRR